MIGPLGRSHRLRPLVGRVLDAAIPAAGRAGFSASAGLCVEVLGAAAAHPRLVGAHRVVGRHVQVEIVFQGHAHRPPIDGAAPVGGMGGW